MWAPGGQENPNSEHNLPGLHPLQGTRAGGHAFVNLPPGACPVLTGEAGESPVRLPGPERCSRPPSGQGLPRHAPPAGVPWSPQARGKEMDLQPPLAFLSPVKGTEKLRATGKGDTVQVPKDRLSHRTVGHCPSPTWLRSGRAPYLSTSDQAVTFRIRRK